jgi:hypothetical protein
MPDGSHQTVYKKLVLFRGGFFPRVPDLAVATFHQPSFQVDGMAYEGVCGNFVSREWEGFEGSMKVCNAILG